MAMSFSLFYAHIITNSTLSGVPEEEVLQALLTHGLSSVTVSDKNALDVPSRLEMIFRYGLSIGSIYGICPLSDGSGMAAAERIIDFAAEQKTNVLIVPGNLEPSSAAELKSCKTQAEIDRFLFSNTQTKNMSNYLSKLASRGANRGVAVSVEDFDSDLSPTQRIGELLWFMKNTDGLRWTYDTGNFAQANENHIDGYEKLKGWISHVHLKDRAIEQSAPGPYNLGMKPSVTGEGYIGIGDIISRLKKDGYNDSLSIELYGIASLNGIEKSIDFVNSQLH